MIYKIERTICKARLNGEHDARINADNVITCRSCGEVLQMVVKNGPNWETNKNHHLRANQNHTGTSGKKHIIKKE